MSRQSEEGMAYRDIGHLIENLSSAVSRTEYVTMWLQILKNRLQIEKM